ncbi:MAG: CRTAC1 family protein [Gammaproteobacteria bacterium]|nr:CRTAC1 family protein [Gammaproteobacteria bacterium]
MMRTYFYVIGFSVCALPDTNLIASNSVTYENISIDDETGIEFRRAVSPNNVVLDAIKQIGFINSADAESRSRAPVKPHGSPGVAIFDYDGDGDLDIYATNSLGVSNSLYQNQYRQTGELTFIDVALQASVSAIEQDSTGACVGDIDNDGDRDLLVLGNNGTQNMLFENSGDGNFINISHKVFNSDDIRHPAGCSMGDVNADGLLDIAIGNTFDNWFHRLPLVTFNNDFLLEANQILINKGDNHFKDESLYAGLVDDKFITWGIALVDYDLDGDLDLITADDQGAKSPEIHGGRDDGYIRIYENNGSGKFTNVTEKVGTNRYGAWMGLSFGDFNSDGYMDIFATNSGFYITSFLQSVLDFPNETGDWTSGWFLGQGDGRFIFPGAGEMIDTPFGWGTSVMDYDNDGDSDIIYHGGVNMGIFVEASNPGVILNNDGAANFSRDEIALSTSTDHLRRNVQGMAVGDLNDDGSMDIVTVSAEDWPASYPLAPLVPPPYLIGSPFDDAAKFWPTFMPVDVTDLSKGFLWSGLETLDGTLSVEISHAKNHNNWIKVTLLGGAGLLKKSRVNRDGIGAVVTNTPKNGNPVMWPVIAGSSYASQDSLEWIFGLGESESSTLEVLWPGGVRNRLYNVHAGERINFPEIPCSYTDKNIKINNYFKCVSHSLLKFHKAGYLSHKEKYRYLISAIKSYLKENPR